MMPFLTCLTILVLLATAGAAGARDRIDLNGAWRFAIDPTGLGEHHGWHQADLNTRDWAEVQVPHCWTVDPRYPYTGTARVSNASDAPAKIHVGFTLAPTERTIETEAAIPTRSEAPITERVSPGHIEPSDGAYETYFPDLMAVFRARPYVVGAAVWTYND